MIKFQPLGTMTSQEIHSLFVENNLADFQLNIVIFQQINLVDETCQFHFRVAAAFFLQKIKHSRQQLKKQIPVRRSSYIPQNNPALNDLLDKKIGRALV